MKFKKFICITLIMVLLSSAAMLATACGKRTPNAPVENPVTLGSTPAVQTKPNKPVETKPQKETEKPTNKETSGETPVETTDKEQTTEKPTEKPTKKPTEKPTKEPVTLPPPSPTNPDIVIPTVKPTEPPTVPTEEDTTGVPYNPSVSEIPEVPAAPAGSTNGTPLCPAQLVQLLPSGHINEADKNFTCAKMEVRLSNKGSSTMRIFPNGNVTVSNITGYDRELSLINSNDVAVPYIDIPAGGTAYIRFKVLGEATLFSTQKYNQETTVHFTFYYGNTIYDGACTAGVGGVVATKR